MTEPGLPGLALFAAVGAATLVVLFAGLNRIPWRYALEIGVGTAAIVGLATLATNPAVPPFDPGHLVLIGAALGAVVLRAYERGMALRRAEIDRILAIPNSAKT
jgi:hypothetical protein